MVRPEGVEPPTYWFVASCSIQLSYGRTLLRKQPSKNTGIHPAEQTSAKHGKRIGRSAVKAEKLAILPWMGKQPSEEGLLGLKIRGLV